MKFIASVFLCSLICACGITVVPDPGYQFDVANYARAERWDEVKVEHGLAYDNSGKAFVVDKHK